MSTRMRRRRWLAGAVAAALAAVAWMPATFAEPPEGTLPEGFKVQSGGAQDPVITPNGNGEGRDMTIQQDTPNVAIGENSSVTFNQADASYVALNRIKGQDVSEIYGNLTATGRVNLINPNGILFGGDGEGIDVGSIVASTARIDDNPDGTVNGEIRQFADTGRFTAAIDADSAAAITNERQIQAQGGLVLFHAAKIVNTGSINDPNAANGPDHETLATASGCYVDNVEMVALSPIQYTNGEITYQFDKSKLQTAEIENSGQIFSWNGHVVMTARTASDLTASVVNMVGSRVAAATLVKGVDGSIQLSSGGDIKMAGDMVAGRITATAARDITLSDNGVTNGIDVRKETQYLPDGTVQHFIDGTLTLQAGRNIDNASASVTSEGDMSVTARGSISNANWMEGSHLTLTAKGGRYRQRIRTPITRYDNDDGIRKHHKQR